MSPVKRECDRWGSWISAYFGGGHVNGCQRYCRGGVSEWEGECPELSRGYPGLNKQPAPSTSHPPS